MSLRLLVYIILKNGCVRVCVCVCVCVCDGFDSKYLLLIRKLKHITLMLKYTYI